MPINNPWLNRGQQSQPQSYSGIDSSYLSYDPGVSAVQGAPAGTTFNPTSQTGVGRRASTTYSGPGGNWTNQGGAWTDASGHQVGDLGGYLNMRNQMQRGADFSGYQNALNPALAGVQKQMQDYQALLNDPSRVQQSAGYQFALNQGNEAINRSAAAKGQLNSGNVLAELAKYGQGMASQNYQQQLQNQQQAIQNQMAQVNSLADLMRGSQQFGLNAGYYQPAPMANQQQFAGYAKPTWY